MFELCMFVRLRLPRLESSDVGFEGEMFAYAGLESSDVGCEREMFAVAQAGIL